LPCHRHRHDVLKTVGFEGFCEMLWVAFAVMTGAAVLCALWPLSRRGAAADGEAQAIAFHKAQLAEIDRDVARGQLPPGEAAGARAEAARRLIAASDAAAAPAVGAGGAISRRRIAAVVVIALIPAIALGVYGRLGSPGLPDAPLWARAADPAPGGDLLAAVAKVEAHLLADPHDGRGFQVIAPVYMRMGRYDEAAKAYERALLLLGEDAQMRADYGEALTAAAGGVVTAQARAAFEQALATAGDTPKARFYLGLAAEQEGDTAKAVALYSRMVADGPADAPWLGAVRDRLASLTGAAPPAAAPGPAPRSGEAAAIAALDPASQQTAIRGMVARLAARLAENGDDAPGWQRLIRAYGVLHETDKARDAMAKARKAMAGNEVAARQLDALAQEFGL
jgi:cytochrome c-type biogenesis protein CcmH